ncbi:hypothetical protein SAMD00023353_4800700 [Rosellinia necatrix]|uniref:Uncharacterized protein n=1 Tax=Rosellinia necatrix TaxID=77044 RepID=A0A1S8A9G9_ROSNE|nr:hypothetical protein SAMD00023353_4800700 [Rosellinia necatrix]
MANLVQVAIANQLRFILPGVSHSQCTAPNRPQPPWQDHKSIMGRSHGYEEGGSRGMRLPGGSAVSPTTKHEINNEASFLRSVSLENTNTQFATMFGLGFDWDVRRFRNTFVIMNYPSTGCRAPRLATPRIRQWR